jgi:hypothetical protein
MANARGCVVKLLFIFWLFWAVVEDRASDDSEQCVHPTQCSLSHETSRTHGGLCTHSALNFVENI